VEWRKERRQGVSSVLGLRIEQEREGEKRTDWKAWEKVVGGGNEQGRIPILEALRGEADRIGGRIGHGVGPTPDFSCSQEMREQI
jgi:hypothetical protein